MLMTKEQAIEIKGKFEYYGINAEIEEYATGLWCVSTHYDGFPSYPLAIREISKPQTKTV